MKFILKIIIINSLFFVQIAASTIYQDVGNNLNTKETNFENYPERSEIFKKLTGNLLKLVYLTDSPIIRYINNTLTIDRVQEKNEEYFKYFDLCFFNMIYLQYSIDQGNDTSKFVPQIQPRLASALCKTFQSKTADNNLLFRKAFIDDLYCSLISDKFNNDYKADIKEYLETEITDNKRKRKKLFRSTDKILKSLNEYLIFNETEIKKDLFDFKRETPEIIKETTQPTKTVIQPLLAVKAIQVESKKLKLSALPKDIKSAQIIVKSPVPVSAGIDLDLIIYSLKIIILFLLIILLFERIKKKNKPLKNVQSIPESSTDQSKDQLDAIGKILINDIPKRYENFWKISQGGMGVIFGAYDNVIKRKVAIKMILPSLSGHNEVITRFVKEARAVAALNHPNILKIFDVGGETYPYMVMEYLQGVTLANLIEKKDKLSIHEIKFYSLQMADAFKYCHEEGIIHRDIKPANIIIVNNYRLVKVVDFGLAKNSDTDNPNTSVNAGSPKYMAPEQIKFYKFGIASDVYSFGITLYLMAAGTFPFDSNLSIEEILATKPKPVSFHVPNINKLLELLIMKCIEKNPLNRFENFNEIKRILLKITT